jgi:hypothetical protein
MSRDFDIFNVTLPLARPMATSLSQKMGVGGCGWPMSSRICRSFVAMREEAKAPAYSASATNERTTRMRMECDNIEWLRSIVREVAEKVRAAGDASGGRAGEGEGGVGEAADNHLGRAKDFSSVGVGGGVSEKMVETGHGFGGGVCLLGRKGAGSRQESGIGTTVV